MSTLKIMLKWYLALTKRLLKRKSFLLALLIVPCVTLAMNIVSQEKSGIMTVGYTAQDKSDPVYIEVAEKIRNADTIMMFKEYDTVSQAVEDVKEGKLDVAWAFKDNIMNRIEDSVGNYKKDTYVDVYLKHDSIMHQFAREKLYSFIFEYYSKALTTVVAREKKLEYDGIKEDMYTNFDTYRNTLNDNFIVFRYVGDDEGSVKADEFNYLASPLRGLLAVATVLCCLAAMMFSLKDEADGKYAMFPLSKRIILHLANGFAAAVIVSVIVLIAIFLSGLSLGAVFEVLLFILFMLMCVAFCTFIGILCRKPGILCIILPVLLVAMLVLCPVFVNVHGFEAVKFLLPSYYYLNALYSARYIWFMAAYCMVMYPLCFITYRLLNKE